MHFQVYLPGGYIINTRMNWRDLTYLENGSAHQKAALKAIQSSRIMDCLSQFDPVLVGTIPIDIALPESDLDIICEVSNKDAKLFVDTLFKNFGHCQYYLSEQKQIRGVEVYLVRFHYANFDFEVFGQQIPVEKQYAYRHMLIEDDLLTKNGLQFRNKILALKKAGYKTEPAFAFALGLEGDPYDELLTQFEL